MSRRTLIVIGLLQVGVIVVGLLGARVMIRALQDWPAAVPWGEGRCHV